MIRIKNQNLTMIFSLFIFILLTVSSSAFAIGNAYLIENVVSRQLKAIEDNDWTTFKNTLDETQKEYIVERKNWFNDIILNKKIINNLEIKVIKTRTKNDDSIIATIKQTYKLNDEEHEILYDMKYIKKDDKWVDSGLNLETRKVGNIVFKYPKQSEKYVNLIIKSAQEAYEFAVDRTGFKFINNPIIKFYSDKEVLSQFCKMSMTIDISGWYEYNESVRLSVPTNLKTKEEKKIKEKINNILIHEFIHNLTLGKAKNNIPYWFSEGIASFYSKKEKTNNPQIYWSIDELENKDLETMNNKINVIKYYFSAEAITNLIAHEYGEEKIRELILTLGKYDFVEGTGKEINDITNKRFHKVIPEVLGISYAELNQKVIDFKK